MKTVMQTEPVNVSKRQAVLDATGLKMGIVIDSHKSADVHTDIIVLNDHPHWAAVAQFQDPPRQPSFRFATECTLREIWLADSIRHARTMHRALTYGVTDESVLGIAIGSECAMNELRSLDRMVSKRMEAMEHRCVIGHSWNTGSDFLWVQAQQDWKDGVERAGITEITPNTIATTWVEMFSDLLSCIVMNQVWYDPYSFIGALLDCEPHVKGGAQGRRKIVGALNIVTRLRYMSSNVLQGADVRLRLVDAARRWGLA